MLMAILFAVALLAMFVAGYALHVWEVDAARRYYERPHLHVRVREYPT